MLLWSRLQPRQILRALRQLGQQSKPSDTRHGGEPARAAGKPVR